MAALATGTISSDTICVPACLGNPGEAQGSGNPGECVFPPSCPSIHPVTQSSPSSQGSPHTVCLLLSLPTLAAPGTGVMPILQEP